ncbi:hypothetical protein ACF06L_30155 [Streptomyces sp. NPDC015408]|uniref:hypothetical protein n=1 Tax=Streptomyces sp. NPDC015408 TaxID=3364956 RepID=UPI0036F8E911
MNASPHQFERAALDQGVTVRCGQGYTLRVTAIPSVHRQIVGGGTRHQGRAPSMTRDELEALRDAGSYGKSLLGSMAVAGLPDGVQRAPSAGATEPVTAPSHGTFPAARGGIYL